MASAFPSFTQVPAAKAARQHDAHALAARRRGLLRRLLDALVDARRREAEQQVARLVARSGGKFTDSLEREAERTLLGR